MSLKFNQQFVKSDETFVSESDFKCFLNQYSTLNSIILNHFNIPEKDIDYVNSLISKNKSFDSQKKILSSQIYYVQPQCIILAQKSEIRIRNGKNILKTIKESFSYISIIKTLIAIVQNKQLLNLIETEILSPCAGSKNHFKSFTDTDSFKNTEYFQNYPHAIRLDLFYDDAEVCNPIGSKRGMHKIGLFYFTIQNFPSQFNSDLKNIFLLQVCYSWDIKKFGFKKILSKLFSDLKKLENGIEVHLNDGKLFDLRAIVVRVCADTLAAHEMLGFLSPSCTCFCRSCLITRQQLQTNYSNISNSIQKRSKALHFEHLQQIQENPTLSKKFGVKENTILNELEFFNATTCAPFDIMHDVLEGVAGFTIKIVLRLFINNKYFTVEFLNERIEKFRYGPTEFKNKPSPTFDQNHFLSNTNSIPQNAVQTWLLLRALPFMIGHCVPIEAEHNMSLIILMIKIIEIVFSLEINDQMIMELDEYLETYENLLRELFPNLRLMNKHHHIRHYVEMIKQHGPPYFYNCLRYEAKHAEIKQSVRVGMNFINLPFSITKRQAFLQSQNIAKQTYEKIKIEIISGKKVDLRTCASAAFIEEITTNENKIEKISSIKINKMLFKKNYILVNQTGDIFPTFYKVVEILKVESICYFFCSSYLVKLFNESLNSYEIEETENFVFLNIENIEFFYKPLSIWYNFECPVKQFISRKEYY